MAGRALSAGSVADALLGRMASGTGQPLPTVRFGARTLPPDRAAVLAVLTRIPDVDRGVACSDLAVVHRAVDEGADIVDLGGVLAGPGADVGGGPEEQARRAVSLVAAVRHRHPELLISVPAWRPEVAQQVVEMGADLLDHLGPGVDPRVAALAAEYGCGLVCSRTGGGPRDVVSGLAGQAATLVGLGVPREAILIDPTPDLGQRTRPGLELLRRCDELVATGWPVLMGPSSTDLIGEASDARVDGQACATLAATALAAWARVRVFRAHQVRQIRRVLEMVASIAGTRPPVRATRGLT